MTSEPSASTPADAPLRSARPPATRHAPASAWPRRQLQCAMPRNHRCARCTQRCRAGLRRLRSAKQRRHRRARAYSGACGRARRLARGGGLRGFRGGRSGGAAGRVRAPASVGHPEVGAARAGRRHCADRRRRRAPARRRRRRRCLRSGPAQCVSTAACATCARCDWAAGAAAAGWVAGEVGATASGGGAAEAGEPPTACADADARPVSPPADGELHASVRLAGADDDTAPAQRSEHELGYDSALPLPGGSDAAAASGARDASGHAEVVAPEVVPATRCTAQIIEVTRNPIAEQQLTLLEGKCEGLALPLMRLDYAQLSVMRERDAF
jgi:hypothetical protein